MTAREMTEAMLAAKGVSNAPRKAVSNLTASVQSCLHKYKGGFIRAVGQGMPGRWALVGGLKKDQQAWPPGS
jgi:hypothetical protein